jgi:hypothetical protein
LLPESGDSEEQRRAAAESADILLLLLAGDWSSRSEIWHRELENFLSTANSQRLHGHEKGRVFVAADEHFDETLLPQELEGKKVYRVPAAASSAGPSQQIEFGARVDELAADIIKSMNPSDAISSDRRSEPDVLTSSPPAAATMPKAEPPAMAAFEERAGSSRLEIALPASERIDLVAFSVFAPPVVAPTTSFLLNVWATLDESDRTARPGEARRQREEMIRRASGGGRFREVGSRGPVRVPLASDLVLSLEFDSFSVADSVAILHWEGDIANASFIVRVPELQAGTYVGTVRVTRASLLLARVHFSVDVSETATPVLPDQQLGSQRAVQSAFASYASDDRALVLARVQGIRAAGIDVFLDLLSLRAGDRWQEELQKAIATRDILYLFWSPAARASEWVEREWRAAFEQRGRDFIWPVPLADVRDAPPPPELQALHFNDDILAHIEVERQRSQRLPAVWDFRAEASSAPSARPPEAPAPPRASAPLWARLAVTLVVLLAIAAVAIGFGGGPYGFVRPR